MLSTSVGPRKRWCEACTLIVRKTTLVIFVMCSRTVFSFFSRGEGDLNFDAATCILKDLRMAVLVMLMILSSFYFSSSRWRLSGFLSD